MARLRPAGQRRAGRRVPALQFQLRQPAEPDRLLRRVGPGHPAGAPLRLHPGLLPLHPLRLQGHRQGGPHLPAQPPRAAQRHGDLRRQRGLRRAGLFRRGRPDRVFFPRRHPAAVLRLGLHLLRPRRQGGGGGDRRLPAPVHREAAGAQRHRRRPVHPLPPAAPGLHLAQRPEGPPRFLPDDPRDRLRPEGHPAAGRSEQPGPGGHPGAVRPRRPAAAGRLARPERRVFAPRLGLGLHRGLLRRRRGAALTRRRPTGPRPRSSPGTCASGPRRACRSAPSS